MWSLWGLTIPGWHGEKCCAQKFPALSARAVAVRNCTCSSGEGAEAEHLQHPGETRQRPRSCSTRTPSLWSSRSEHGCSILAESVCGCWPQHLQQGEQDPGLACGQVSWSSLSDTEAGNGCQTSAWSSQLCVPTYTFLLSPCDDLPRNSSST